MAPRGSLAALCARAVDPNFEAPNAYAAAAPPDCNNKRRSTLGVRNIEISNQEQLPHFQQIACLPDYQMSYAAPKLLLPFNGSSSRPQFLVEKTKAGMSAPNGRRLSVGSETSDVYCGQGLRVWPLRVTVF